MPAKRFGPARTGRCTFSDTSCDFLTPRAPGAAPPEPRNRLAPPEARTAY
jgi:hypothetical protein